ncbi:hypothetical protein [Nonomuraea guangzhouensis]|uniref:DUF3455 domain-containing protein n=1 Tax=Nonomuraea guangzhouensis TaxID=1291555 RepID=A0ABW4GH65_9ACTN|nr:hypothetical protein [Nonomuraea guangzhouensis]
MPRTLATLGALAAATLLTPTIPASAHAATNMEIVNGFTRTVKESAGIPVTCPPNEVLLGRSHSADWNGNTTYYCGRIYIDRQPAQVSAPIWSDEQRESSSHFEAPADHALVGRQHSGNENGPTRYAHASLTVGGQTVKLASYRWTPGQRESRSYSKAGEDEVMTGREHFGDENAQTQYQYARISDR